MDRKDLLHNVDNLVGLNAQNDSGLLKSDSDSSDSGVVSVRNLSYELRTPLAILLGYAELLEGGDLGDLSCEQRDAVMIIVNRAYELSTLVERVSMLTAIGTQNAAMESLSLADIVKQVVEQHNPKAVRAGLSLTVNIEPDIPLILGHRGHLEHAISCLLENAIKFTQAGGGVTVHVYSEHDEISLSVLDTGVGIAEKTMAGVFSDFHNFERVGLDEYSTLGLGLALVRAVLKEHKGRIDVESHVGQGSRFTLTFPAISTPVDQTQSKAKSLPLTKRRILVVDDEAWVLMTLRKGLEKLPNCDVTIAHNGSHALQLFEQERFDLLITDYKMSDMDGLALAEAVRQRVPQTPVIIITAYTSVELREQSTRVVTQVLHKPVRLKEVRRIVAETLGYPN